LKKNVICLINQINKFCAFHMIAHFYRFHTWLEREKDILPLFVNIMTSEKIYIYFFFKNITFWTTHLFINLEQQSMKILHDHTFLYIALTIGVGNILVAPFFKSQFLWKFMLFLKKKHDFLSNYIFLLNQLNKVCTFYAIAPFNTLWT